MNILFVCSSNQCRSPFCEFAFKKIVEQDPVLRENVTVRSGGVLNPMKELDPRTIKSLEREGIPKDAYKNFIPTLRKDDPTRFEEADVIIGMTRWHKWRLPRRERKKFMTLSEAAEGKYTAVPDPWFDPRISTFFKCMDVIKVYLQEYADKLHDELA